MLWAVFGELSSTSDRTGATGATAHLVGGAGSSLDLTRRSDWLDRPDGGVLEPSFRPSAARSSRTGDGAALASLARGAPSRVWPSSLVGLAFRPVTQAEREELAIPERWSGVVITEVRAGSSADEIELSPMDVIVRVGNTKIETGEDLVRAVGENERVVLTLIRSGFTFQRVLHRPFHDASREGVDAPPREVAEVQAEPQAQGQRGEHVRGAVGERHAPAMERLR